MTTIIPSPKKRRGHTPRFNHSQNRDGVAAVEFSIIAVMLVTLVLGMIEISRGIMVNEVLSNAARVGCRIGCQAKGKNADITAEVNTVLSDNGLDPNDATITIYVNDAVKDVSTAKRQDKITVSVSIPVSKVYWTTSVLLKSNQNLTETIVMMRQK